MWTLWKLFCTKPLGGKAMNVVQVPRRFAKSDWGGTETVILETSKRLLRMGHQTEILCPSALADREEETIEGVRVTRLPYFYPYWGLSDADRAQLDRKGGNLFSFALMRALKRLPGLDLIHLHTGKRLGGIARYVARKRRIPYVVSLHGGVLDVPPEEARTWTAPTEGAFEWGKVLGWWVGSRRVLDDAAAILCVGKPEQEKIQERFPHKRVVHLPNGVDLDRFATGDGDRFRGRYGVSPRERVVLTVGRIGPQKNQMLAVRAFRELLKREPDARLVLVGHVTSETYRDQLDAAVREAGLDARVTLVPGLDSSSQDLVDAYHAADVFLLPSVHEPFGIVILEAWAAGLPVAASRVGGIPAFVADGEDGLLFDPQDERACLEALARLLSDPALRRRMGEAGRNRARQDYSWDRITERLVSVYDEVVNEDPLRQ